MHEYEMKCFSKIQVLNPVSTKLRFSNILPLKTQTKNMFCEKKYSREKEQATEDITSLSSSIKNPINQSIKQ